MAEITRLLRREDGAQLLFHAQRVFAAVGEAEAARDADAVRVADVGGLVVDVAENEVRGLAPDAGETRQLLHRAGDPAAVLFKENFRALDEVFGLGIVKAAGLDGFADLFIAGVGERLERRELCVQRGGDHVHTRVGALGGEPHGEKQFIIFLVLQRAHGVGVELLQRLDDAADSGFGFHGATSRIILAKSIPHISQKIDRKSVGKREKICYDKSTGEMEV